MSTVQTAPAAAVRQKKLTVRPGVVFAVAAVVAVLSFLAVSLRLAWPIAVLLVVAAAVVTVWATVSAVVRRSVLVAPLAVCLVALGNPVVLSGLGSYVERHVGAITLSLDRGVVLWAHYPGIAGWDAPEQPERVDATRLAQQVQTALRGAVGELSDQFGWAWQIGEGDVGVQPIPNGFGGDSLFVRVDAPRWTATEFDGSDAQRTAVVGAAERAAAALGLTEVADTTGDVTTSDGVRRWALDDQALTLTISGDTVELTYAGGPFLAWRVVDGEYQSQLDYYSGLPMPPTITTPEIP